MVKKTIAKKILTEIIKINPKKPEKIKIKRAAEVLRNGGLVAFPTETVYGLGANALDEKAVENIFKAKGRPSDNPLIVHIASKEDIHIVGKYITKNTEKLMKRFWPGPLSIIVKKKDIVPNIISGGLDTVAVRMPDNKIALALIKEAGVPVAAPSANLSGKPSPTNSKHVINDLKGKVDVIIEGPRTVIGLESTVIDVSSQPATILRPGKITLEDIRKVIKDVEYEKLSKNGKDTDIAPRSPGMKYRHYSPNAKLIIIEGDEKKAIKKAQELIKGFNETKKKVCIIRRGNVDFSKADVIKQMTEEHSIIAREMFRVFRECDQEDVDVIIMKAVEEKGLGVAIMNRMRKAAYMIINVDNE